MPTQCSVSVILSHPDPHAGGSRANNFQLIRLAAATQVFFGHWGQIFGEPHLLWIQSAFTKAFPGVPVFFFVSGFLIAASFRRSGSLRDFYRNRALRIYPAMLVCLAACVLGMLALRYPGLMNASGRSIAAWLVAQATCFQKYNPPWAKFSGNGLNAPLWTVMIELQFYALTPLLLTRSGDSMRRPLAWMAALSLAAAVIVGKWHLNQDISNGLLISMESITSFRDFRALSQKASCLKTNEPYYGGSSRRGERERTPLERPCRLRSG